MASFILCLLGFAEIVVTLDLIINFEATKHHNQRYVVLPDHLPKLPNDFLRWSHRSDDCTLVQACVDVARIDIISKVGLSLWRRLHGINFNLTLI